MLIYLLRHGIAEAGGGMPDSERALTAEGKRRLRDVMKVAKAAEVEVSLVLTSPYKRALQTAEIAIDVLEYKGELLRTKALIPSASPEDAWEEARVHKDQSAILLVGHEPLFSALGAYLLGAPDVVIDFKKAGLLCVDVPQIAAQPRGILRWYLTPKLAGD